MYITMILRERDTHTQRERERERERGRERVESSSCSVSLLHYAMGYINYLQLSHFPLMDERERERDRVQKTGRQRTKSNNIPDRRVNCVLKRVCVKTLGGKYRI